MAEETKIQWTDATWNVAVGCKKVDEDCKYCYMYRQSLSGTRYDPAEVRKTKTVFNFPLKYKEIKSAVREGQPLIFTSSLTDVFIEEIDFYRHEIWDIIKACPHLTFQILTKRPERIIKCLPKNWGNGWDNVWLGTSVGSNKSIDRINALAAVPAKTRFLSLEPLHSELRIFPYLLKGLIHWVIVGGESGNERGKYRYRPCEMDWIHQIISDCQETNVPVFIKQVGTHLATEYEMTDRHGGNYNEFPINIKFREFPNRQ